MTITVRMETEGFDELQRTFGELARAVRAEFLSEAIRPAAELVLATARSKISCCST